MFCQVQPRNVMEILDVLQFLHNFVGINIYRIVITLRIARKIKIGTEILFSSIEHADR